MADKKPFYILFSGSRNIPRKNVGSWISRFIRKIVSIQDNLIIIHGNCNHGVDLIVKQTCERVHIPQIIYPATWNKYGKAAGRIRNTRMIEHGNPDLVICIFNDLKKMSKGTKMTMNIAKNHGLPIFATDINALSPNEFKELWQYFENSFPFEAGEINYG